MIKILIVEDNPEINKMIKTLLIRNNYEVESAFSGTEAMLLLKNESFDLILLDLMLPGLSGEELLININKEFEIPIICVSAKDDLNTKIRLIQRGLDDYITKPFNNEELLARIGAVLRRVNKGQTNNNTRIFKFKDLVLDSENHTVSINDKLIELTAKEYSILELLMTNPKKVFTKHNIFESIWSEEYVVDARAVIVHISNLRNKLNDEDKYIKTVWGIGYKMQDN